jgi:hypothetical protein
LWRIIRKNAMEVNTNSMALVLDPKGFQPIIDENVVAFGSAVYLVASLINHHCVAPNLAPCFLGYYFFFLFFFNT